MLQCCNDLYLIDLQCLNMQHYHGKLKEYFYENANKDFLYVIVIFR